MVTPHDMTTITDRLASAPRPWQVVLKTEPRSAHANQTRMYITDATGCHVAECFMEGEAQALVDLVNGLDDLMAALREWNWNGES